jgi:hypothetical protein
MAIPTLRYVFLRQFIIVVLLAFLSTNALRAQDCLDNALYVTPTGNGLGTRLSPSNLLTALTICKGDTSRHFIMLATGTYTIGETLVVPSGVTIDGNYDAINGVWKKSTVNKSVLSVSPPGDEVKTISVTNTKVTTGHFIGIRLDSVSNIKLKDFTLEVHKTNVYRNDMTLDGDGKSIYAVFARKSEKIFLINLNIITDDAGDGFYGYQGLNGAWSDYNIPARSVPDPRYYRPKPSQALEESYKFRAGGEGGNGGSVQRYYRCLTGCLDASLSATTYCAAEKPLPRGGIGGKNGGLGGEAGENCEMDCYYEYYKSKAAVADKLLGLLSLPTMGQKDPEPDPGANGRDGTGNYNGGDYTDQTIYPYDEINYYYIPGMGANGGDGSGGSGGGGGGAGGIRTLGLVPEIPGLGDFNFPAKMLGGFNKLITLIGGDDVCNAEIVNNSTPGGNGGAGGEGGEGGGGGHGGGANFGVFALGCKEVIDRNSVYTIGAGGKGGFGGYGGIGGQGGAGQSGRFIDDGGWSYQGAKGGRGGKGGDGSRGQHGANGRRINKIGVSTVPEPYILSDLAYGCTNSVISLYSSGDGNFYGLPSRASNDVNLVQNKPSGTTYTSFMKDIQVVAVDTGRLAVGYHTATPYLWLNAPVKIKTIRPWPAMNVPAALCLGDSLKLTAETTVAYSWKVYDSNENVIYTSDKKSMSFFPPVVGTYTVGFQAYDLCCGFSAPQYRTVKVTTVPKPIITKENHQLYCYGTDSTKFEMTTPVDNTSRVLWSNGKTEKVAYMKETGSFFATLTNADGCWKSSDMIYQYVSPLPEGKPRVQDLHNICTGQEITLSPDFEYGRLYNFYPNATTSVPLANGVKQYNFRTRPYLPKDSISYFVRKVSSDWNAGFEKNCVALEAAEVKIYRDKYPPVIIGDNLVRNLGVDKTGCGTHYSYTLPKAEDNCSSSITVEVRKMPADHYYPIGETVDIIRYTDISNNILDYEIHIVVRDAMPPVLVKKPAARIEISNEPGTCGAYYPFTLATATDNCSPISALSGAIPETITTPGGGYSDIFFISGSQTDSVFSIGNNVIRQTWTDAAGNVTTFEQNIVIKDAELPKLQCSDLTYYVEKGKNTVYTAYNAPLVTDNCSTYLTSSFVSGFGQTGEHAIGTTTEIWKAIDASGNIGLGTFKLTVLDTISPSINCRNIRPSALAMAGTDQAVVTFAAPPATDNSGSVLVTTEGTGSGVMYKIGEYPLVYTATDNSGNTASCVIVVVVSDAEAPTLTCPPDIDVANTPGSCGAVVNFTVANAPDNDGSSYTPYRLRGLASGSLFPLGTTQQVFRVADASGNIATCAFNVTVTDTQAPVFTACPGNKTEFVTPEICGKMISLTVPAATDNSCMLPFTGFVSGSAGGFFPVGVTHQVYRSTDVYGNSATCEFDVTVVDNTILSVTCPPNVEINSAPGLCGAVPSIQFPKANNSYGCLEWQKLSTNGIGDMFTPGIHTVTYRAKALTQTAVCSFTVTVNDIEPPKISQPDNIVVTIDNGTCGQVVTFAEPTVIDNCTNSHLQLMTGLPSGAMFPIGITEQKYIAFDNIGSTSTTFTISVIDNVAPVFTDVPNIRETTADLCGRVIGFTAPVATDNSSCFAISRLSGLSSGDIFPVGTTSQVYVVRDASGNTDTTRFTIEVTSSGLAQFNNCPADVVVMSDNDLTQVVWYDVPGRRSCAGMTALLISGKGSGATFPVGSTTETYLLTDASGKTDTCSFQVFVAEKVPPFISCNTPYYFELDESICGAMVTLAVPSVDDYGGSGLQTIYNNLGPNNEPVFRPQGSSQVEWTAVDKSGNRTKCTMPIFVGRQEQPANPFSRVKVCEGTDVEIDPKMSGKGPYTYKWSYYVPATFETIEISTDSIFRIPNVRESHERQYSLAVFSVACGYNVYRREFLLTVNPSPVVTLTGLAAGYCDYDLSGKALSYSPAGGVLVGPGIVDGKFYPSKAGIGTHTISYTYHDAALDCPATASLTVNVYGTPLVAAFIDVAYCINSPALLLDATNSTYSGPGISGTTFNAAIAGAGTHAITRNVTVNGCMNTGVQQVRIQGNVPDASILTAGPICSNKAPVKLEAASAGGSWSGMSVALKNDIAYFHVKASTLGKHKVYYEMVDDVCVSIDSVEIEIVNSDYAVPFTYNAYCYDQGLVAMDVSDNKNYFGYGIENNKFNPAAYDTTSTALFGVSTVNSYGCMDTVWRAMAVLKPELIAPNKLICKKGDLALLDTDTKMELVTWFDNTTGYTKSVYDTGSYFVELRNSFGCVKTDTFRVQSKQSVLPSLINNTHQLFKCDEATATLTVNAEYISYLWSTGVAGQSITVSSPGEYKIYVTDHEDCELYDSIVVKNHPLSTNQLVDNGTYLEAIASPTYEWYKDEIPIAGASSQTLQVTESGDYYVLLLDENGCVSASEVMKVILTSVDGEKKEVECLIYPNPGNGRFVFQFTSQPVEDLDIVFINALGQPVKQLKINSQSGQVIYPVNLEAQPAGVYWALVTQKGSTTIVKLVKVD